MAMAELEQVDSPNSMDPELETGNMTVLEVKDECIEARVRFFCLDDVHTGDVFFRVGGHFTRIFCGSARQG